MVTSFSSSLSDFVRQGFCYPLRYCFFIHLFFSKPYDLFINTTSSLDGKVEKREYKAIKFVRSRRSFHLKTFLLYSHGIFCILERTMFKFPVFEAKCFTFVFLVFFSFVINTNAVSQTDIVGPVGSERFGETVSVLPNGNIVVVDYFYDASGPVADVGAVHLYNGENGALISTLTGSTANDLVGLGGIVILPTGNFVVSSRFWDNGGIADAGAVTFCNGTTGCNGTVTPANSLVGGFPADRIGNNGVTVLSNGNFVVSTATWHTNTGAATWCSGTTGFSGTVSDTNSLVGTSAGDFVSIGGIIPLTNGNYVVRSTSWNNGGASDAGAATWGSGTSGIVGEVSAANSLVGTQTSDSVGNAGITSLPNGNYVVNSVSWNYGGVGDTGAVTWGSGMGGTVGAVSPLNSIVGSQTNDFVGNAGITILTNGNYVVNSRFWNNAGVGDSGAVTWCNGAGGTVGAVSALNSLIGERSNDFAGSGGIIPLTNGNYVVNSSLLDAAGINDTGAVTWGNGATGTSGIISAVNSLVGSRNSDLIGNRGVFPLTNGNYVVASPDFDLAVVPNVGAATLGNGAGGTIGELSITNSLIGTHNGDSVASGGVTPLTNGNYVVNSFEYDSTFIGDIGAVTWGNGASGITGEITSTNSLIGSQAVDGIGNGGVTALPNGNYVVNSPFWNFGGIGDAGAVTWGNGATGTSGIVGIGNSLIGSQSNDFVGISVITILTNGNYVVRSSSWSNGAFTDAGAVTWCSSTGGTNGIITAANSLVGSSVSDQIGSSGILPFANGNYVVKSPNWDNEVLINVGAVTWSNGTDGTVGTVSTTNSLVGTGANDAVGSGSFFFETPTSNYVFHSASWDNGGSSNAGAITYGAGNGGTVGTITADNSVRGNITAGGSNFNVSYNAVYETIVVGKRDASIVSIFNPTYTAVADGNWSAGAIWNYGAFSETHDVYIPNSRSVNLDVIDVVSSVRVDCTGDLSGGSPMAYIIGSIRKDFCAAGFFTYPTGTANDYSAVDINTTALGTNPSSLTITAVQGNRAGMSPTNSLQRYWTLTESGDLTVDAIFNYQDGDVVGSESSYGLFRFTGMTGMSAAPFTLDTGDNTMSKFGISNFSDWAIGNLVPLAASVNLGGRIITSNGNGIKNAVVSLTDINGNTRNVRTGAFGYYNFENVEAGATYTINVAAKRFTFANPTQVITVKDNIGNLDFVAE